jgi:hypothetical protein
VTCSIGIPCVRNVGKDTSCCCPDCCSSMRLTGAIIPQGNWQGCKQQTVKEAGAMVIVCHSMQSHSDTHDYGGLDLSSMFRKSRPQEFFGEGPKPRITSTMTTRITHLMYLPKTTSSNLIRPSTQENKYQHNSSSAPAPPRSTTYAAPSHPTHSLPSS